MVTPSTTSMSRSPSPRGSHDAPGFRSFRLLTSMPSERPIITRPSQNGRKAEPGPPEPHHEYCLSAPAANATEKTSSRSAVTRSARRTRCLLRAGLEALQRVLVRLVQAIEILERLVAGPVGRAQEVALDVLLLPLLGRDHFLQRVLPPLHGLGRHVGGA